MGYYSVIVAVVALSIKVSSVLFRGDSCLQHSFRY